MQQQQPPYGYGAYPYNPYAAPAVMPLGPASVDSTGHRPGLRVIFLALALTSAFFYLGGIGLVIAAIATSSGHHPPELELILAGEGVMLLGALLLYVKIGVALYWLHGAWKWVPMEWRAGKDNKRYTPGDVFMLLIPYYHLYWMFPINLGLCDAMERLRQQTGATLGAKRDTAMWAAICEIIPFANFFVAPFFWFSHMKAIDAMHDDIMNALARRA
jgi:hypothetical protein